MALVRFLVEIYHLPQIKLGIKFEVEILAGLLDFSIASTNFFPFRLFYIFYYPLISFLGRCATNGYIEVSSAVHGTWTHHRL